MKQFDNLADAQILALAIVDTFPEPFVLLDEKFRVLTANRCFYDLFKEDEANTRGRLFYTLGDGQWDIPALRQLLETIIPEHGSMDGFEVDHDFPHLGRRTMLLNARLVDHDDGASSTMLLAFQDISERRAAEREKDRLLEHTEELLRQQHVLLSEMKHRIANSLQIIASILLLKAGSVASEETRYELRDAHTRVMSVAAVQSHLHPSDGIDQIEVRPYLEKLSAGLAASMLGGGQDIVIDVVADDGTLKSSEAVSVGLIVTELIINAIKYAFPTTRAAARIVVTFETDRKDWKLTVSDNGVGKRAILPVGGTSTGLGAAIVEALARQLEAQIREVSTANGLTVEIIRATFAPAGHRAIPVSHEG